MDRKIQWLFAGVAASAFVYGCSDSNSVRFGGALDGGLLKQDSSPDNAELVEQGKQVFRFETFGDERQWTDELQLHTVVQNALTPELALQLGFKVDMDALPQEVVDGVAAGDIPLDDPQTTLALISLNAVVGVQGEVVETAQGDLQLKSLGITCALCHSTVDDAAETLLGIKGIGHRLDGYPNRQFDPGKVIALSPALADAPDVLAYYNSWGPGMFDARVNHDARITPEQGAYPTVIPPAFGLNGLDRVTFTGDGNELAYWNRYVAVTEMGGIGRFSDTRLHTGSGDTVDVTHTCTASVPDCKPDMVTKHLPALQAYQRSLKAPAAPEGSFNVAAAARGKNVFAGPGQCISCHSGGNFTDANVRLHPKSASAAMNTAYADRSATAQWRTPPLRGIWQHPPYFHDGSAATLTDVVRAYDQKLNLGLNQGQVEDLVEYLKSL